MALLRHSRVVGLSDNEKVDVYSKVYLNVGSQLKLESSLSQDEVLISEWRNETENPVVSSRR